MQYGKRHWCVWLLAAGALASGCGPVDETPDWIHGWRLVETDDVRAQLQPPLPGATGAGVTVAFEKSGNERRLVTLQAVPGRKLEQVRTVEVRYRLTLTEGPPPRLAVVAFEAGGGAYFHIAPAPLTTDQYARERISLVSPLPAAFSADPDEQFQWAQVDRLWIGLVLDAQTTGRFKVYGANLRSEPWRPRRSLPVHSGPEVVWDLAKDPAVTAVLTPPDAGDRATPGMKLAFSLPGHRHMYVLATTASPPGDLGPYHGLALKAKGRLPKGNVRMLVSLTEADGAQYYFEPAMPGETDWTTVTIPFSAFKPADWSPDKNERLDLNRIVRITVGAHGTTSEGIGEGWLTAKDLLYVVESEAGPPWPWSQPPEPEPATKPAEAPPATQPATKPAEAKPSTKPIRVEPKPPPATQPATKPAQAKPSTNGKT